MSLILPPSPEDVPAPAAERLLALLESAKMPLPKRSVADVLGVRPRKARRLVAQLISEGVPVIGSARAGWRLHPAYGPPVARLTAEGLKVVVTSLRAVRDGLPDNARAASVEAEAVLRTIVSADIRDEADHFGLFQPDPAHTFERRTLRLMRIALRNEWPVSFTYPDRDGAFQPRLIHPILLEWGHAAISITGWCTLRSDFRRFRFDRLSHLRLIRAPFNPGRRQLLKRWKDRP